MSDGQLQGLIDIQNEVRLAFGWNYTDDYDSAKQLSLAFEGDAPFGVNKWNHQALSLIHI